MEDVIREWLELLPLIRANLKTQGGLEEIDTAVPIRQLEDRSVVDLLGSTEIEIPQQWVRVDSNIAKARAFIVQSISINFFDIREGLSSELIPLRAVIFVLLHELAHSIATPGMKKTDEKGRAKRKGWNHHDHNEDFYEVFERILRAAETLNILQFSQAFGGAGMSRKRARRIDSFELPGILDFVRLGDAVPRWIAEHGGFPRLTEVYELHRGPLQPQEAKLIPNFVDGQTVGERLQAQPKPQQLRITVSHASKGSKLLLVTTEDLTVLRLRELVEAKFRLKRTFLLDEEGAPFSENTKLLKFIVDQLPNADLKIKS